MQAFRDVQEICELADLGFVGVPYTYDNMRSADANVLVRLDQAAASPPWRDIFDNVCVCHLASPCSDHVPVLVVCEPLVD